MRRKKRVRCSDGYDVLVLQDIEAGKPLSRLQEGALLFGVTSCIGAVGAILF
jgi:hypothetical protein